MNSSSFTEFEKLIISSDNPIGLSVLLLLAWLASCDGHMDKSEIEFLQTISDATKSDHNIQAVVMIANEQNLDALQLASEITADHFKNDKSKLFMEMAIGVAVADGILLPPEQYILLFFADMLRISEKELNDIFLRVTGRRLADIPDFSSAEIWTSQQSEKRFDTHNEKTNKSEQKKFYTNKRIQSLAILGLEEGASQAEIKEAFRRLAKIHHPDRFQSLGEEAVAIANETFRKINEAYNYLK